MMVHTYRQTGRQGSKYTDGQRDEWMERQMGKDRYRGTDKERVTVRQTDDRPIDLQTDLRRDLTARPTNQLTN